MLCNNCTKQAWFRLRVSLGVLYDCTGEEGLKGAFFICQKKQIPERVKAVPCFGQILLL